MTSLGCGFEFPVDDVVEILKYFIRYRFDTLMHIDETEGLKKAYGECDFTSGRARLA